MKAFYDLTKPGIVKLVLMTGIAGYLLGHRLENIFSVLHLLGFCTGLALICAGSLALNQFQEWQDDAKMPRTMGRPIPSGNMSPNHALYFSILLCAVGLGILYIIQPITAMLGALTIFFYNVLYTMFLKKHLEFAAVLGAIPGAAPGLMGYSAVQPHICSSEGIYIFLLMFLWQMPHFWALAIRYKEDYRKGGFPVLPAMIGDKRTQIHIGLYLAPYVGLAIMSPWFVEIHYVYYFVVIPISGLIVYEFFRFWKSAESKAWLRFFIWINVSILVFLMAPVMDRWIFYYEKIGRYGH